jgi:hypothetical protein
MTESIGHVMIDPHPRMRGGIVACEQCPYYIFNYDAQNNRQITCDGTSYIGNPVYAFTPAVVHGVEVDSQVADASLASKIMHEDALCEPDECI